MSDADQSLGYLDEVLAAFALQLEGSPPSTGQELQERRCGLLAEHPKIASGLRQYFDDADRAGLLLDVFADQATDSYQSRDMPFRPGQRIGYGGDYEIVELIAHGGMAAVYKARQRSIDRMVAIKVLQRGLPNSYRSHERFRREALTMAGLRHPGIVTIFDVQEHEGTPYITMEFVSGGSLAGRVAKAPVPPRSAAEYVAGLAETIQFAHEHGVLHRDLKPHNVLIDEHGKLKITDFGLARPTGESSDLTQTGIEPGTVLYMSPEQARADKLAISTRTDIYGLGVILYELITGILPFRGSNEFETRQQILNKEPLSPQAVKTNVPSDLAIICLKCLEKIPTARYQTSQDLASDLRAFLAGRPIHARRVSAIEHFWRKCQRNPALAGAISTIVLLLILGTLVSSHFAMAARSEARTSQQRADELSREKQTAVKRLDRSERFLYLYQIAAAQSKWESSDVESAWRNLNFCPWRLRGWEHDYLATLCLNAGKPLERDIKHKLPSFTLLATYESARQRLELTENGKIVIDAEENEPFRLWDMEQWSRATVGKNRPEHLKPVILEGPTNPHMRVAISQDGRLIVGGLETLVIWDAKSGTRRLTLDGHSGLITCIAFNPDGTQVVAGTNKSAKIWDVASGRLVRTLAGHDNPVTSVVFCHGGRRVASSSDGMLKIWDAATGRELYAVRHPQGAILQVAVSPDGERLACATSDGTIPMRGTDGRDLGTIRTTGTVNSVAFSRDGKRIVTGNDDGTVKLYDPVDGEETITLKGDDHCIRSVCFSPDGRRLFSVDLNNVRLWDASRRQDTRTLEGHILGVDSVAFSPDGALIASASQDSTIRIWDAQGGREKLILRGHTAIVESIAFSPDGKKLVSSGEDGTVRVWEVSNGLEILLIETGVDQIPSVVFSPDGQYIASGMGDGTIQIWDAVTGRNYRCMKAHGAPVLCVSFRSDGKWLLSAGQDNVLKIWNCSDGSPVMTLRGHNAFVASAAFSIDGKWIVSGSGDGTVKLWDVSSGREFRTLRGHTGAVSGVALSPDNRRIVSCGWDCYVKVWDTWAGQKLAALHSHSQAALCVAISPNGRRIVSGSNDGMLLVSDARLRKRSFP